MASSTAGLLKWIRTPTATEALLMGGLEQSWAARLLNRERRSQDPQRQLVPFHLCVSVVKEGPRERIPAPAPQEEPKKPLPERKITPAEWKRRREEAFKDAEEARKTYAVWTASFRVTESHPVLDASYERRGRLWVRQIDEKTRALYWEWTDAADPKTGSRSLYAGTELLETAEKEKTLRSRTIDPARLFVPQILVRDGLFRGLEEGYRVELYANARYQKTEPTAMDWKAIGFDSKEAFEAWWKAQKARGTGGVETDLAEDRPFSEKEDRFDRANPRNKMPARWEGTLETFYGIRLDPRKGPLKRTIDHITMTLRPGDFLPTRILVHYTNDVVVGIAFADIRKDPKPEPAAERFSLDPTGYRVVKEE